MGLRGVGSTPRRRGSGKNLPHDQEMSLCFGELATHPAFADDDERQHAWYVHRARLLRDCSYGQRPAAWWDYDSPVPRPDDRDYEEAVLYENGLLSADETAELMACWRAHFDRAQEPGFVYRATEGWLEGDAAVAAYHKWAGIPRALVREWTRENRSKATPKSAPPGASPGVNAAEPPAVA
jgi:hypothetical protein